MSETTRIQICECGHTGKQHDSQGYCTMCHCDMLETVDEVLIPAPSPEAAAAREEPPGNPLCANCGGPRCCHFGRDEYCTSGSSEQRYVFSGKYSAPTQRDVPSEWTTRIDDAVAECRRDESLVPLELIAREMASALTGRDVPSSDALSLAMDALEKILSTNGSIGGAHHIARNALRAIRWAAGRDVPSGCLTNGAGECVGDVPCIHDAASVRLTVEGLRSLTDDFARRAFPEMHGGKRRGGVMISREMAHAVLIELQDKLDAAMSATPQSSTKNQEPEG